MLLLMQNIRAFISSRFSARDLLIHLTDVILYIKAHLLIKHLYLPILKIRTANHKFAVETGHWSNIPYVNRKCPLCQNDLGDEFHYLMVCNYSTEKRKQLIPNYFHSYPNIIKYQELLKSSNSEILKNLSIFIAHIMNTFTR
jgi:hypothetical protein